MDLKSMTQELRYHGLKSTPQRIWVYDYMCNHKTHPDADEIYSAMAENGYSITRATVYNILQSFVKAGLLIEVKADSTRTRYDANTNLHGHFICQSCNCIYDFKVDALTADGLNNFDILQKDVYFSGICNNCKNILNKGDIKNEKICL